MQTFITDFDLEKSAGNLDDKRLGKQRLEAVQIAKILLGMIDSRWKNHPAVLMWKGYEPFLIKKYLRSIIKEWVKRGYKNNIILKDYKILYRAVYHMEPIAPSWVTKELIISHRSKLIAKDPEYYGPKWPDTPADLEYIWPVKKNQEGS